MSLTLRQWIMTLTNSLLPGLVGSMGPVGHGHPCLNWDSSVIIKASEICKIRRHALVAQDDANPFSRFVPYSLDHRDSVSTYNFELVSRAVSFDLSPPLRLTPVLVQLCSWGLAPVSPLSSSLSPTNGTQKCVSRDHTHHLRKRDKENSK